MTIDAMGTQTKPAGQMINEKGHDVLARKGNQATLSKDGEDRFALAQRVQFAQVPHQFHQTVEKGHSRMEIRKHWIIASINDKGAWQG